MSWNFEKHACLDKQIRNAEIRNAHDSISEEMIKKSIQNEGIRNIRNLWHPVQVIVNI